MQTTSYAQLERDQVRNRLWIVVGLAWFCWVIPPIGLFFSVMSLFAGLWLLIQGVHPKHALAGMFIGGVVPLTLCALYIAFVLPQ